MRHKTRPRSVYTRRTEALPAENRWHARQRDHPLGWLGSIALSAILVRGKSLGWGRDCPRVSVDAPVRPATRPYTADSPREGASSFTDSPWERSERFGGPFIGRTVFSLRVAAREGEGKKKVSTFLWSGVRLTPSRGERFVTRSVQQRPCARRYPWPVHQ